MLYGMIRVPFVYNSALRKCDFRGGWFVSPKNRGRTKKTQGWTGLKSGAVVWQWVPTFKEAVPPQEPYLDLYPFPTTPTPTLTPTPTFTPLLGPYPLGATKPQWWSFSTGHESSNPLPRVVTSVQPVRPSPHLSGPETTRTPFSRGACAVRCSM